MNGLCRIKSILSNFCKLQLAEYKKFNSFYVFHKLFRFPRQLSLSNGIEEFVHGSIDSLSTIFNRAP